MFLYVNSLEAVIEKLNLFELKAIHGNTLNFKSHIRENQWNSLVKYDLYTESQATYAVNNCGANWNEEALEEAKSDIRNSSYSYAYLKDILVRYDLYT